jgi:surface protein
VFFVVLRKSKMTSPSTAFPERILARAIAFLSLLLLLLSENKNGPFLFARAAVRSETWPLGIYKNQTIAFKNFNTDDDSGTTNNEGVGEIMFEASVTSLTKGDLILGSANHASASDGTHTVGAKILALQAQLDAITTEVLGLTPPSPPPAPGMFFTAVALSDDGGQVTVDIGKTAFNDAFQLCPLVKYVRNGADHAYYHRITDIPSNFDAYSLFTYTWKDTNNVLGTDFDLFDTLDDLRSSANKWQFCNYNDPDVGFPRDCGKETGVWNTWFSMPGDRFNARGLEGGASFEMWSGGGCPGMVDPIPSASWAQFVEECLAEKGAEDTGECTEWASTNNYRTMPRWDTSLVEDMSSTFTGKNAFNGDISKWNTEKVTKMNEMFSSASAFNQNIGKWNTERVTDMGYMFLSASAFNHDIGSWNTEKVTNMEYMFRSASAFDQDISSWTGTAATTAQSNMFLGATAFEAKFACADAVTGPASSCDTIKSTWLITAYSYLGEGECRQSDGSYPIKFSKGYYDLNPHTSGTNAEQALDRCKAKCFAFAWCLAAEVVLRDIWDTPECRLITDWNAYVVESTNTFQNNQWGGTQSIDGENYQTYCNGGSSPCSSSNVFDGGKLNSRDGYHCYIKAASALYSGIS